MDILLVGNGFDLVHHLPTTYKDFLNFLERIHPKHAVNHQQLNNSIEELINYVNNETILQRMRILYLNNLWYLYFLQRNNISPNWCDFENEIEYITDELQEAKNSYLKNVVHLPAIYHFPKKLFLE